MIEDSIAVYESRGVQGRQAATRAPVNPVSGYRAQLLGKGWKLTVDEPTRLAGRHKNEWITLTATDVHALTTSLPWVTVLAYAHLTAEAADR